MSALKGLQRLKSALSLQTSSSLRSFTASHEHTTEKMLVKMDNPYKEADKGCTLCGVAVDFKNTQLLSQFVSSHSGRIYGRHITGLCGKKQREVSRAIKKAHSLGFMSVTLKHPQFITDPNIIGIKPLS